MGAVDQEETGNQPVPLFTPFSDATLHLEGAKVANPKYRDGNVLPKEMLSKFRKEGKPCVPLEEIDPFYRDRRTFVVVGQRGSIHRFSRSTDNYLTFSPNSTVRKWAIYLHTNWLFSAFIVATLLVNVYALMRIQSGYITRRLTNNYAWDWTADAIQAVDYVCLAVYCFELIVKLLARGLFAGEFTAVRNPWVWLDIMVIWTGFTQPRGFLWLERGAVAWIRIFKLIPLIPSIRQAFRLSGKAVKQLGGMLLILCSCLWFFSLIGLQIYMGTLTQKCIKNIPEGVEMSDEMYLEYNQNKSNWYSENNGHDFRICGNASGSWACPDGYTCLQGYGANPDNDYTNFDDISWSLLSVLRITGEDFTEEILKQLIAANGPWQINFFVAIFLLITFPMGCLFFSVLGNVFAEQWEGKTNDKVDDDSHNEENLETAAIPDVNGKNVDDDNDIANKNDNEATGLKKNLHSLVHQGWLATVVICVIYVDIFGIISYHYGIQENPVDYNLYTQIFPYIVFVVYLIEFFVKLIAAGPRLYFRDAWNSLDLLILFQFCLQFASRFGFLFAPIRLLKLVKYWPSLQLILTVYYKTLKTLKGWILYGCIVMGFIVLIAPFQIGQSEWRRIRDVTDSQELTPDDIPRWTFIDFWHSFRMVVRMQIAEWIETLWDVLPYAGYTTFSYYLAANICGALFLSYILVTIVFLTMKELKKTTDPFKEQGLGRFVTRALSHIPGYKSREVHLQNGFETLPITTNVADQTDEALIVVGKDESTGDLRKKMQRFTEHWAYKTMCLAVILFGSFSMTVLHEVEMDWENGVYIAMLATEILFTGAFVLIVIFELVAFGLKESVTNCSWLFDTLIVVENIVNLCAHFRFLINLSGPFGVGAFCVRCFRPLMLISRVKKLKTTFGMIKLEMKQIWETILAIFFIWLLFDTFAVHWLNGLYHKCIDPEIDNEVRMDKSSCLASNYTWANSDLNFDDTGNGFLNMVFLTSRMGWVSIINDASDATDLDMARVKDNSKMWLIYFIVFVLSGGLGALGVLFAHALSLFQQDKGRSLILTDHQAAIYTERKEQKEKQQNAGIALEDEYIPVPSSSLRRSLYNFVTNWKFDAFIMVVIILDNIFISLDSFQQSALWDQALSYLFLILIIYIVEAIVKLIAWDRHYFRSGWNILDFVIVLTGVAELIFSDLVAMYFVSGGLLRILRLLRIFRFLLAKKCGSKTAKVFISAASNVRHAFGNLILFQLTVIWAFTVLGTSLFEHVRHTGGLDWLLNFGTVGNSFRVMILLLGFPCLDGFYMGLSKTDDCEIDEEAGINNCGKRGAAVVYLALYAGITFLVMLNMYAVFVGEIISEFGRLKEKAKNDEAGERISLQDVVTEKDKDEEENNEKENPDDAA